MSTVPAATMPSHRSGARGRPQRVLLFIALVLSQIATVAQPESNDELMRFGFSNQMFEGLNINDARASMRVWTQEVATNRGIPISPDIVSFEDPTAIQRSLQNHQVEAVALTTEEFWQIRDNVTVGTVLLAKLNGRYTDDYLLLVHRDQGPKTLAELKGKSITWFQSPRSSLALPWLNVTLAEAGIERAESYFSAIKADTKLTRVMLPVFFGKTDACVVTQNGYELMAELNPQIAQKLVPIAKSQPLVSSLFFFRGDYDSPNVERIVTIFTDADENVATQQIISLFQQQGLVIAQPEELQPSMELMDRYHHLNDGKDGSAAAPNPAIAP